MRLTVFGTMILLAIGAGAASGAPLTANRAGSCVLGGGVAAAIRAALLVANASQRLGLDTRALSVDSIVIRSATNPNGGQKLAAGAGAYTGAVVCTFDRGLLPPAVPYSIAATTAATRINDIDLLATQIDTWIQYKKTGAGGKTENLICLSTRNNDDCFSIFQKGSR
ncbi:MAG: hypothetical protein AB7I59_13780 [Geminicoccaceae bacterium]